MSNRMPREEGLDHSFSLMREGYLFITNRRHSFQSDVFETRILGKKAICMGGREAAELFYDNDKFIRKGAAPHRVVQTLFGKNGVQALDGQAHVHRKGMFMALMSPKGLQNLTDIATEQWEVAVRKWEGQKTVVLYEEVKELLCRIACQWAGVPLKKEEMKRRTKDLSAMFESPAAIGPAHWLGRLARNRTEMWIEKLINDVRNGSLQPPEHTALHHFSWHRDLNGKLLDVKTVAVEVINILRPIVAIAIFIDFTALAIHQFPEKAKKLMDGDDAYMQMFVQEVRRYFPFFPFVTAKVKSDFMWHDFYFKKGTLTLLDLYGTNHDPKIWHHPEMFSPERFAKWEGSPFSFIPQGGGDYFLGHRCAGEWVTVELMKVSLHYLMNEIDYVMPKQDLSYSLVSVPSIPHSKIVIEQVTRREI